MKYYEITLRVSAEALTGIATAVPAALEVLGSHLVQTVRDETDKYENDTATIKKVDGPFMSRGRIVDSGPGSLLTDLDGYQNDLARTRNELTKVESAYDGVLESVMLNAPACWDGDVAMEVLAVAYVRHLEALSDLTGTSAHKPTCEDEGC